MAESRFHHYERDSVPASLQVHSFFLLPAKSLFPDPGRKLLSIMVNIPNAQVLQGNPTMRMKALAATLTVTLVLSSFTTTSAGPIGSVLGNGGTTLHRFKLNNPGGASVIDITLGGLTVSLDAIDFRPATGELFGYDDVTDTYYTVDPATGDLTIASTMTTPTGTDLLDIDWNPTIDRMRTVTELDENIVFNPNNGVASDGSTVPLFYDTNGNGINDAGDSGIDPNLTGNAYTNSFAGATTTTQFILDHNLNTLSTLANNAGALTMGPLITLGGSPLDFGPDAGFDILSVGGMNTAYALLNVSSEAGLYTIDLDTGIATFIGALPDQFGTVTGLAVTVPEPSTLLMGGLGAAGLVLLVARRSRQQRSK